MTLKEGTYPMEVTTIVLNFVEHSELEVFIEEQFDISSVEILDAGSDLLSHTFDVQDLSHADINSWKFKRMHNTLTNLRQSGNISVHEVGAIMDQMCTLDMIPAGRYVVNVSW